MQRGSNTVKKDIHPKYFEQAKVICACGNTWTTGSTQEVIRTEMCYLCHPFFTGEQRIVDTAGQVDRFQKRKERADQLAAQRAGLKAGKDKQGQAVFEFVPEDKSTAAPESVAAAEQPASVVEQAAPLASAATPWSAQHPVVSAAAHVRSGHLSPRQRRSRPSPSAPRPRKAAEPAAEQLRPAQPRGQGRRQAQTPSVQPSPAQEAKAAAKHRRRRAPASPRPKKAKAAARPAVDAATSRGAAQKPPAEKAQGRSPLLSSFESIPERQAKTLSLLS